MASSINSTVSLREIIFYYLELSKQSEANFLRVWRIAYRGLQQMSLNNFLQPIEVVLPVNQNGTVTLPANYLQYVSVGEDQYNGKVRPLQVTRHYNIDTTQGCIVLPPHSALSQIHLTYIGSPEPDSDYRIPVQFQEAMIDFISWQDLKHMPTTSHFNRGDKQDRARAYKASYKLAQQMYEPFRTNDVSNVIFPPVNPYNNYL